jgi:uncharacterized protein YllA (UPF0747 family)
MQLKTSFKKEKIPFPILVLRSSALVVEEKKISRFFSMGFDLEDIFKKKEELHKKYLLIHHKEEFSLKKQIDEMSKIYSNIIDRNKDHNMERSILASKKSQLNLMLKLEKKLGRSIKKNNEINVEKINRLKDLLFPAGHLQERYHNFIAFYLEFGDNFIKILKDNLHPLNSDFVVLAIEKDKL